MRLTSLLAVAGLATTGTPGAEHQTGDVDDALLSDALDVLTAALLSAGAA